VSAVASPPGPIAPPPGPSKLPPVPAEPGTWPLQATAASVTVHWFDRSDDEQKFVLYKRDLQGAWREIDEVPTRNVADGSGDSFFADPDHSISGQCYMVAAVGPTGAGYSAEQCTVRPDPSRFPLLPPPAAREWYGLTDVNDGTGDLFNHVRPSSSAELT